MCIGGFCLNKRMALYSALCVDEAETHLSISTSQGSFSVDQLEGMHVNGISLIDCLVIQHIVFFRPFTIIKRRNY
jgi:hypothetical protein